MAFMAACSSFATFHVHTHGSNPAVASFHGSQLNWKGRRNPSSCKLRVGFAAKAMGSDSNDSAKQTKGQVSTLDELAPWLCQDLKLLNQKAGDWPIHVATEAVVRGWTILPCFTNSSILGKRIELQERDLH